MKKKQRKNSMMLIYVLLISVIFMVAGYAILSQNISVTGTATADTSFSLVWENQSITTNVGGTATAAPTLTSGDTVLNINPVLEYPGAYIEVTATIRNTGALDAEITGVVPTDPVGTDIVVTYTPSFAVAQTLASAGTQQVVIKIEYDADSTNQGAIEEDFGVVVTYTQDTD